MNILQHGLGAIAGAHPTRPDPYLIWAQLTNWADLVPEAKAGKRPDHVVPVIVALTDPDQFAAFRKAVLADPRQWVSPVHAGARHVCAWVHASQLALFAALPSIERFDLCQPIHPRRWAPNPLRVAGETMPASLKLRGTVLIGVIDNGCPFAHASLVNWSDDATPVPSTRIAALWDMRHRGLQWSAERPPALLGYGRELLRAGAEGLDALLGQFTVAHGLIDEAGLYRTLETERPRDQATRPLELRRHVSHGAHVLDVIAGRVPLRQRVAVDADTPPGWLTAADAAADPTRSDVVFVQLPTGAVQDNSGGWLGSHVLDALRYIVSCADPKKTTDVVINLSYGGTAGPHNGSSLLERAIDELISQRDAGRPAVHVFVAAGNAFGTRSHAALSDDDFGNPDRESRRRSRALTWHVPPDAEAPAFMELWMPAAWVARKPVVRVTPPGDTGFEVALGQAVTWPQQGAAQATVVFLEASSRGDGEPMVLLAVSPTGTLLDDRPAAPHGLWAIDIALAAAPDDKLGELHAYIARNDRDIGTLRRGRPSCFVDERDDPSRYLRRAVDDPGRFNSAELDPPSERSGSTLRRRGTLSATANGTRTEVAAGYQLRSGTHAAYSSAGPSRSTPARGPTAALVTDLSAALPGMRAAGNYSGVTFRLVGTSSAAPQLARKRVAELAASRPGQAQPNPPRSPPVEPGLQDPEDLYGPDDRLPVGHPGPLA